jgi:hypothetical protein
MKLADDGLTTEERLKKLDSYVIVYNAAGHSRFVAPDAIPAGYQLFSPQPTRERLVERFGLQAVIHAEAAAEAEWKQALSEIGPGDIA